LIEDPDQRVTIPLSGTCAWGRCCAEIGAEVLLPERRQVVEVVIQRAVTEYHIMGGTCTCGRVQRSAFPEGVTATVQYGPGVSALAVYLTQSHKMCNKVWRLSSGKCHSLLGDSDQQVGWQSRSGFKGARR